MWKHGLFSEMEQVTVWWQTGSSAIKQQHQNLKFSSFWKRHSRWIFFDTGGRSLVSEASSHKKLWIKLFCESLKDQIKQGLQKELNDIFLQTRHSEIDTARRGLPVTARLPLNLGGSVSDQLALSANVRLRKHHIATYGMGMCNSPKVLGSCFPQN